MKGWKHLAAIALGCSATAVSARAPSPPTPLFSSDVPIHVSIQGPFAALSSNRAEVPHPATMVVDGVTYPITLTPRGITRLRNETCDFPPL